MSVITLNRHESLEGNLIQGRETHGKAKSKANDFYYHPILRHGVNVVEADIPSNHPHKA